MVQKYDRVMLAKVNGTGLFYETLGRGMPLYLMHGGMGLDHSYFRPWLDPLAERLQLVYYDHRGNGRSAFLDNFRGIDHRTWADDADALRRHLGHEKIVVLGHSCGAFVALEYALRYGRHLAGLILCDCAPAMDYPDVILANAQARATTAQKEIVGWMFVKPLASNEEFRAGFHTLLPLYFQSYDAPLGAEIVNRIRYNHHAYNHTAAVLFPTFNSLGWLDRIRAPTLVVGGGKDWITPPEQGTERLHARITGSRLALFGQSGHFPFVEEQERFLRTIGEWIAGLPQ